MQHKSNMNFYLLFHQKDSTCVILTKKRRRDDFKMNREYQSQRDSWGILLFLDGQLCNTQGKSVNGRRELIRKSKGEMG